MRIVEALFVVTAVSILVAAPALAQSRAAGDPAAPDNPYGPPACTGVFTDVTCPGGFAVNWIEQFYADGITSGCSAAPLEYCPDNPVTRAQMAVFVERAMRGTGVWSPGDRGSGNTGLGFDALLNESTFTEGETALGFHALYAESFANSGTPYTPANTAVGIYALAGNQPDGGNGGLNGTFNTAVGAVSLGANTMGFYDTAVGVNSLVNNSTGQYNTAVGANTLADETTAIDNTAIGWKAGARGGDVITGYTGAPATFVSTMTGSYNTFVGVAGSTAEVSNCTAVGMDAYCDATDQVRLGNVFVTSIGGKVAWSALSDARAKRDIRDLDLGLDFVLALRPVSFTLNNGNGRTDMGFVAQDIETLLGDGYNVLDIGGDPDRTLSLRYTDLIAPLVKAVQEQQAQLEAKDRRVTELETRAVEAEARIDAQQAQLAGRDVRIEALEARLAAIEARLAGK